jgi:hypothetical protein
LWLDRPACAAGLPAGGVVCFVTVALPAREVRHRHPDWAARQRARVVPLNQYGALTPQGPRDYGTGVQVSGLQQGDSAYPVVFDREVAESIKVD